MRNILLVILVLLASMLVKAQTPYGYIPSNRYISTLEKNLLFNAPARYRVTVQGTGSNYYGDVPLKALFDGQMSPQYCSVALDPNNPLVIEIEGLPNVHTQVGAWVGWSTRYWAAKRFKIEGFNSYSGTSTYNTWVTLADVTDNTSGQYMVAISGSKSGGYTKLRFTFYEGTSNEGGKLGLSELFFIHSEAAKAYDGLLVQYNSSLNVGIGTNNVPNGYKLAVDGKVIAEEITIKLSEQWPDYVFEEEYPLMPINELEAYIKANKHLPNVPSEQEVGNNGVDLGEMNALLLRKMEEMTLYIIESHAKQLKMEAKLDSLNLVIKTMKSNEK